MNKLSLLSLIVLNVVFVGCNNTTDILIKSEISVDFDKSADIIDLCQYIDTSVCEMIVLETTEECLIGEVTKIAWHNDTLVICDSESKSVFFFNKDGNFLSKICRFGRSGQEYMDAYDFYIGNDEVIILDNMNFKILCYDFSGNFKYSFKIESGVSVCENEGKIFVYNGWGESCFDGKKLPLVTVYNKDGNKETEYLHISKKESYGYDCDDHFLVLNSGFNVYNEFNNTLYEFKGNQFVASYSFNFGNKTMPYKYQKEGYEYIFENGYYKEYVSGIERISESDRYIFCRIAYNNGYILLYDKKTGYAEVGISSDYAEFGIFNDDIFIDGENIYSYQSASLIDILKTDTWKNKDRVLKKAEERLKSITQNLTDTDNGVIIRMKLKGYDED